jgi:DNA repair protein RadC
MNNPSNNTTIKSWAEEDRPREKLILKGKSSLSNAELIAILIGSGSRNESAVELSKKILAQTDNNLQELSKYTIGDLTKFQGIGEAKAISIIAAMELGRRYRSTEAIARKKVSTSNDAFDAAYSYLSDLTYEEFYIILLTRNNEIMGVQKISEGGQAGTAVDPKKIFITALNRHANSIILCHNHPSGNLQPSQQDIAITNKMVEVGHALELSVLDHIIVGQGKYFSFADQGMIKSKT